MDARQLRKRADGPDPEALRRLTRAGLIPADGKPRKSWPTYTEDAVLLARVASAFVKLGASAMDAQSLLLALLALPPAERENFARQVILTRFTPRTSRIDWHVEGAYVLGDPLLFPLRDFLDEKQS